MSFNMQYVYTPGTITTIKIMNIAIMPEVFSYALVIIFWPVPFFSYPQATIDGLSVTID